MITNRPDYEEFAKHAGHKLAIRFEDPGNESSSLVLECEDCGTTFGVCAKPSAFAERFAKAAIEKYYTSSHSADGEVDFDDANFIAVSLGDNGAYVNAWLWVEDDLLNLSPLDKLVLKTERPPDAECD